MKDGCWWKQEGWSSGLSAEIGPQNCLQKGVEQNPLKANIQENKQTLIKINAKNNCNNV